MQALVECLGYRALQAKSQHNAIQDSCQGQPLSLLTGLYTKPQEAELSKAASNTWGTTSSSIHMLFSVASGSIPFINPYESDSSHSFISRFPSWTHSGLRQEHSRVLSLLPFLWPLRLFYSQTSVRLIFLRG